MSGTVFSKDSPRVFPVTYDIKKLTAKKTSSGGSNIIKTEGNF
jgi:hypothetical protein